MEMNEVFSSSVAAIGYDEGSQELHVEWQRNGRVSVYKDVPAVVAERVMKAASIGQALREGIQQVYEHRYI